MFCYVYLGERCMSRIGSKTVKTNHWTFIGQRTLNFGPRTGSANTWMRPRSVMLRKRVGLGPTPPPPKKKKKKNSKKGKNFPKLRMSWFRKQNLPRFRILQATFPVRRRSAPVLVMKLKITSWIIRKIDINIIVPVEFIIIFCSKNGPWIFLKAYTY